MSDKAHIPKLDRAAGHCRIGRIDQRGKADAKRRRRFDAGRLPIVIKTEIHRKVRPFIQPQRLLVIPISRPLFIRVAISRDRGDHRPRCGAIRKTHLVEIRQTHLAQGSLQRGALARRLGFPFPEVPAFIPRNGSRPLCDHPLHIRWKPINSLGRVGDNGWRCSENHQDCAR